MTYLFNYFSSEGCSVTDFGMARQRGGTAQPGALNQKVAAIALKPSAAT
jgi:hypothetical protein